MGNIIFLLIVKHKHLMINGALPDKSCTVCYLKNSMFLKAESIHEDYHPLVPGIISIVFKMEGVGPFHKYFSKAQFLLN